MSIAELKEQLRQRDKQIAEQAARIKELEKEIRELKELLVHKAKAKEAKPPKDASNFSIGRHERKQQRNRRRKKSTGRKPKDSKRDLATETIDLYWHGANRKKCVLRREQFVWRLIDGKARYIHYRIFDEPNSTDLPPVDGVRNGKCEYGFEVLITLAYLVYWTGVSIDKACAILAFFTGLELSKSQADSLLSQLATDWQVEYDAVRASRDRRLSTGRQAKVNRLQARIRMICRRYGEILDDTAAVDDTTFVRLQNELVDNIEKLFVFVLHPEVESTNNRSEHQARPEAMARKTARTSKTEAGAKRRGVIMSVLASLSKRLEKFTLGNVLAEINRWIEAGQSVFQEELASLQAATASSSRAPP
jgi:archaellum component FlaC